MSISATKAWDYLSDVELARWFAEPLSPPRALQGFLEQCTKRGLVMGDCAECGAQTLRRQHDYMCLLCRREQAHPEYITEPD